MLIWLKEKEGLEKEEQTIIWKEVDMIKPTKPIRIQ